MKWLLIASRHMFLSGAVLTVTTTREAIIFVVFFSFFSTSSAGVRLKKSCRIQPRGLASLFGSRGNKPRRVLVIRRFAPSAWAPPRGNVAGVNTNVEYTRTKKVHVVGVV